MKKIFVLLTAALALTVLSCEKDNGGVNDVDGQSKELKTLDSKASTWNTDKRVFDLSFSGGATLSTTLIGFDAELAAGKYTLKAQNAAGIGDAVLEKTLLDSKAVTAGSITVGKSGKKYNITATLTPEGGKETTLTWSGDIEWPADPAPKQQLSVVLSAQANKDQQSGAVLSLTMNLASAGISSEIDWSTYTQVWKGEGGYLALDLYSEDGYLAEGIYKPCATAGTLLPGEFGIGWDPGDLYGIGMVFENWGTCWWKVSGGAAAAEYKITEGIVTVRKVEAGWQIAWGKEYPTEIVFEGAIEALTKPEETDDPGAGPVLNITSGLTYTVEDQTATNTADDQGTPLSGVQLFRFQVFQGSDLVAEFDLVVTEGTTDFTGEYTVKSYPHENLTAGNGWGFLPYMVGGSYYVVDGKYYYIPADAIIKVTDTAGKLKFEFSGAVQKDDYSDGGQGSVLLDNVTKA